MSFTVEIELPRSGRWFRYSTEIESPEEAESIMRTAEKNFKTRVKIE